ncbi:splicing factor YJU2-like [Macrosteles quadrilineatus]|uniref:splicing factor YJU2-like n=1 Tax=Macrosteles quadrilineatus TaxID=74068 RepID=UPI0023E0B3F7|nr:splicing factor YJU2-like [Macrosteles quadrilineatus]XP_054268765.1 splicing factor YJU2-like [Macrosteles quadrilineatus]
MSERKVLNKYYPPDFDPSKIPRMKLPKNRQYTVRLMAPFNMRCKTCGEYIYKGKKFNARKEDVEGEDYFGIRIYRFYIKCTRCLQEISFKTDPKNTDYEIEAGATRNFMALKLAEEQAQREEDERKEEEANNPMKLLENRTQQSKQELELLESLEDLKDLNRRQRNIDYDSMLSNYNTKEAREKILKLQEEQDEEFIKSVFSSGNKRVVEEEIVDAADEERSTPATKKLAVEKPAPKTQTQTNSSWTKSVGVMGKKPLSGLVRLKKPDAATGSPSTTSATVPTTSNIPASSANGETKKPQAILSLVGAYSDSDGSESS